MNKAAMNLVVHAFSWTPIFTSFGYMAKSGILGLYSRLTCIWLVISNSCFEIGELCLFSCDVLLIVIILFLQISQESIGIITYVCCLHVSRTQIFFLKRLLRRAVIDNKADIGEFNFSKLRMLH